MNVFEDAALQSLADSFVTRCQQIGFECIVMAAGKDGLTKAQMGGPAHQLFMAPSTLCRLSLAPRMLLLRLTSEVLGIDMAEVAQGQELGKTGESEALTLSG